MTDLPRQFIITGPKWNPPTRYAIDLDDVDSQGYVKITYAPGEKPLTYPADHVFRQNSEETVRRYLEEGSWVIVEDSTPPTANIEDLI